VATLREFDEWAALVAIVALLVFGKACLG